jgi:hypothetical protein
MYSFKIYPDGKVDERSIIFKAFGRKDYVWCGYNNLFYDDAMLNHLINNPNLTVKDLHNFSSSLIGGARNPYRYKSIFRSIDLLEIIRKGYNVKSLKGVAVNLKYPRIQDLPIDPNDNVKPEQVEDLRSYNINDVLITREILEEVYPLIETRSFLTDFYKGELDLLTESDSGICKKLLTNFYNKKLDEFGVPRNDPRRNFRKSKTIRGDIEIKDILFSRIEFETKELKDFHNGILTETIIKKASTETSDKYTWKHSLEFGGNIYSIGLGGIHTIDKPAVYYTNDEWCTLDLDVTSQYPTSFIYNQICPQHLYKDAFLSILQDLLTERVKYKKLYKQTNDVAYNNLQAAMKIALNTFFGLTNSKTFWLFDPKATFTCTINNQMLMLMLIEVLTINDYQVISANTDGITIRCKHKDLWDVRDLIKSWEKMSGFTLEETFYDSYLRRDISNYIAVTPDGKTKYKGCFTPQEEKDLLKAFVYPVTTKALVNYFLHKKPVEETIYNCTDIYDFCSSKKVGKQFTNYLRKIKRKEVVRYGKDLTKIYAKPKYEIDILEEKPVQQTLRFFISKPDIYESDVEDLLDGYNDYYSIGESLVKKKLVTSARYEIQKDEQVKKCWWIIDLKTNTKYFDKPYPTKKEAIPIVKELNQNDESGYLTHETEEHVAGKFITLFNDYYKVEKFEDYRVDYDYYIELVQKEINKIEVV